MLPRILGENLVMIDLLKSEVLTDVIKAIEEGKTIVIDNVSSPIPLFVNQLIKPKIVQDENKQVRDITKDHYC